MQTEWRYAIDGRGKSSGEIITEIFEHRGINIDEFLYPKEEDILDSEKLHNIEKAYDILMNGVAEGKSFVIWEDVDLDGIASGTIMYKYLKGMTDKVNVYINEGKEHGVKGYNDINIEADIIIVVDSINDFEYYKPMLNDGKQVIILDHHEISDVGAFDVPNIALVSSVNDYPNNQLSGAGVVWKFCRYIDEMELDNRADDLADLAACGIIADMCDMSVPENRAICNMGLSNPQSLAIKQINGSYPFNAQAVSFGIAPLINAAQRLRKNRLALDLFLSDDVSEVKKLVKELKTCKEEQAEIVEMLMPEMLEQAQDQIDNKVICVVIDTDADVSGLLGNKLISKYQRPILILKNRGLVYAGSGRGYGIEDFMTYVNDTGVATAEGHPNAFGVIVDKGNLADLLLRLDTALRDVEFKVVHEADVLLDVEQIDDVLINNFKAIDRISGSGFKPLTVMLRGVEDYIVGDMSKGKHLKLDCGGFLAIKWNYDGNWDEFDEGSVDMIGTLSSGYFGRTFYRQLIIQDYKVGDNDAQEI